MTLAIRVPVRATAAAALAVAALAVAPAGANGSCGDYVQVVTDPQPTHEPAPCPGCSKAPASPILPLTAPILSPSEQSVTLTELPTDTRSIRGWAHSPCATWHPVRLTSTIFHPPRAA